MNLLIDTHILLWWLDKNSPLKPLARQEIDSQENEIYVSCVSLWEIAIKVAAGKLKFPGGLLEILDNNGIHILPLDAKHAFVFTTIPRLHGDPFDRMLVAQALKEGLTLMTHDRQIEKYSVPCFLV